MSFDRSNMTPPAGRPEPSRPSGTKAYWRLIYGRSRPRSRGRRSRFITGSLVAQTRPAVVRRGKV